MPLSVIENTQMNSTSSDSIYAAIIYGSSTLSLLTNSVLLALYMRCPLRTLKTYKHFFAMTALHDMVASSIMLLCVPRAYNCIHYYITTTTGLIQHWEAGVALLLLFWFTLYSSFMILTNGFVYRYICVCRPELSYLYKSKMWILIICTANGFVLSYACLTVMVSLPSEALKTQVYTKNAGMEARAFVGVSTMHTFNEISIFLAVHFIPVLSSSLTVFFCAVRIHLALKQSAVSHTVKRHQREILRILLFLTTCPTIFVYTPSFVIYAMVLGNFDSAPLVTDCIGVLLSLHPLFNSIVTMFSIADYRRYLISLFSSGMEHHLRGSAVESERSDAASSVSHYTSAILHKRGMHE